MQRLRNFCFTAWDENDCLKLRNHKDHKYSIYGEELCPTTGKTHYQGYVEFNKAISFTTLKQILGNAHIEARKGSQAEAITYCKKDGKFKEHGSCKEQGKRTDLEIMRDCIGNGGNMRDITQGSNNYQTWRAAEMYLKYNEVKRNWKPEVIWIYGGTGTGKTKLAVEIAGDRDTWMSGKDAKWFQGYDAHEVVILDDFRPNWCTFTELLRLLDRYEYTIEHKGGSRQFLAKTIIITCPKRPEDLDWGPNAYGEDKNQLLRRIDLYRCTEVGGNTNPDFCV